MVRADRAAVTIAGNRAGPSLYGAAPNQRQRQRGSPKAPLRSAVQISGNI
jgi:hypothetical protein